MHNKIKDNSIMNTISEKLVEVALSNAEGFPFERFCSSFYAGIEGGKFVPLGGVGDGGADGLSEGIFESGKPSAFYQVSIRKDHRTKIRQTVKRLKEFGRIPKVLIYLSSQNISHIDNEESELTEELGVVIRIRDAKYIISHINDSIATIAAYNNHLSHYTNYLSQIGASKTIPKSVHAEDPSVYVFLQQEVDNRLGNSNLLETITDTLILWSLNETDPEKGIFLKKTEIFEKIVQAIPWSKQFIKAHFDRRLESLVLKGGADGRQVTWYRKEDKYCLPFETRQIIQSENLNDESLRINVLKEFEKDLIDNSLCDADQAIKIAELAIKTIELFFEKEGLSFSYFLKDNHKNEGPNTVDDRIDQVLDFEKMEAVEREVYREGIRHVLLKAFYSSTETQRVFLFHLSRTYILLFSLQAEPRIIDYFQGMTSNFKLYVGSDIIIRALTERYLNSGDQTARNMLKMATEVGVELYLSEPILEEIITHIEATNFEFINHFAHIEPNIDRYLASQSNKVLVRTYFYAKEMGKVNGWKTFLGQFVTYNKLGTADAKNELKGYLQAEFSMEYMSKSDLEGYVNNEKVLELKNILMEEKSKEELAYNDALMVHAVYGLRRRNKEMSKVMEYGFSSWWLTQETKIQKHTSELVKEHGARYIMRPEFLLNYFALAPKKADIISSFKTIFPSTIGLQMGHRMREDTYHSVLNKVGEWKDYEPSRIKVLVGSLSNKLKADHKKIYDNTLKVSDILQEIGN